MATLEQAAYEIAVRALGQQEQALTELRARTGTLLTASSLIASFLGAQASPGAGSPSGSCSRYSPSVCR